jgi:hypothetical protein
MPANRGELTYTVTSEAWYANAVRSAGSTDSEIMVTLRAEGGGCYWEFAIRQVRDVAVRVEVFSDAWEAFSERPDVFAALAELGEGSTLDDVKNALDGLGVRDATERTAPDHVRTIDGAATLRRRTESVLGPLDADTWDRLRPLMVTDFTATT